jgi:uracil-DNA glycosylase
VAPLQGLAQQLLPGRGWSERLADEFRQPYMAFLAQFLAAEEAAGKNIYPPARQVFNALNSTPLEQVKAVILGQDPYHGPCQAHGLSFSVLPGTRTPPSLVNMFKEIRSDLGIEPSAHGCLQAWADQGVLLLNSVLTVEQGRAGAHQGMGWEEFTNSVIAAVNEQNQGVVFMLWGSYAHKKGRGIDHQKHLVLKAPHPSPLSAYRGFFGCQHFSHANRWLGERGLGAIDWALPQRPCCSPR